MLSHSSGGQTSKIKALGGPCSLWRFWEDSLLPRPASGGCWPSLAQSCITPACACLHLAPFCVSSLPPLTHRAPKLESGATSIQGDSLSRPLTSLHLQKPYLPKVTVTGSRGTYPWRPPFHPPHLVRHPGRTRARASTCQAAGSRVGPPHSQCLMSARAAG